MRPCIEGEESASHKHSMQSFADENAGAQFNPTLLVSLRFRSGVDGSIGAILHAVDVTEVGTRNVYPSCDAHESLLRRIIHDG